MPFASPENPNIYESFGKCIYCNRGSEDGATLTKEHIIPLAFKGSIQLRGGSCLDCAAITTKFERACARNMFGAFRAYRGIRSGRHKKGTRTIPFAQWKDGKKKTVWLEPSDLPDLLFFLQFLFDPFVLSGVEDAGTTVMLPLVIPREGSDFTDYIGKPTGQFDPHLYACLMAKIAHGYATVRLGYGSFKPLALDLILGVTTSWPVVVGGRATIPPAEIGHTVRLDPHFDHVRQKQFVVATIRLFAQCNTPLYTVAVGELPYDSTLLTDLQPEPELPLA